MTMDTVPKDQRIYPSCVYPVACVIIVMYVDNNGVRHNCEELLAEFDSDVAKDDRVYLHREGEMSSFLSAVFSACIASRFLRSSSLILPLSAAAIWIASMSFPLCWVPWA